MALLLQPDVVGPFDEACYISFGLDILSNAKVLGLFLRQRPDHLFGLLFLQDGRGRAIFSPWLSFLWVSCSTEGERHLASLKAGFLFCLYDLHVIFQFLLSFR